MSGRHGNLPLIYKQKTYLLHNNLLKIRSGGNLSRSEQFN